MFLKILLILIIYHIFEHAAVFHIVPVQDVVAAHKIPLAFKIQVNGPAHALFSIKIMVQIKIIVRSLDNGIINIGVRYLYPAHGIRILLHQFLKMDGGNIRLLRLCLHRRRGRLRLHRRGCLPGKLRQTLILLLCPFILQIAVKA